VVFLPLYDSNGNITAYLDESGTIVASYTYDAFGRTIAQSGPLASAFPHRFSTKYHDPETGLYYYGYRFYSPELMRWMNRDPIAESGGNNLYGFVGNKPLDRHDMLGLWQAAQGAYATHIKKTTDNARRLYRKQPGDTLQGLAVSVGLNLSDMAHWARFSEGHTTMQTSVLISGSGWEQYCYVSVPNVWIDADLLRGGGAYSRLVNIGGTIGSFVGTDLLISSSRKVVSAHTVAELISAVSGYSGHIWGMTVYGHGGKDGTLSQSGKLGYKDWNVKWMNQQDLIRYVGQGGYKLAIVNMMQCYSGTSTGTYYGQPQDWSAEWRKHAITLNYYEGLNVLGLDTGWVLWPWNWF
jgi:RHS repeat-associated protein